MCVYVVGTQKFLPRIPDSVYTHTYSKLRYVCFKAEIHSICHHLAKREAFNEVTSMTSQRQMKSASPYSGRGKFTTKCRNEGQSVPQHMSLSNESRIKCRKSNQRLCPGKDFGNWFFKLVFLWNLGGQKLSWPEEYIPNPLLTTSLHDVVCSPIPSLHHTTLFPLLHTIGLANKFVQNRNKPSNYHSQKLPFFFFYFFVYHLFTLQNLRWVKSIFSLVSCLIPSV